MSLKLPKYNYFIDKGWIEYDTANEKDNTLIILNSSEVDLKNSEFFTKILSSVNLQRAANCSFLEVTENDQISIALLINSKKFNRYIFFGLEPINLGLSLQLQQFKVLEIDQLKFIKLPSLNNISQSLDFKKKLWEVLKEIYK